MDRAPWVDPQNQPRNIPVFNGRGGGNAVPGARGGREEGGRAGGWKGTLTWGQGRARSPPNANPKADRVTRVTAYRLCSPSGGMNDFVL